MTSYPRFDPQKGGSITGIIEGLNRILDIAVPGENQEGGTVIIPGRGRLAMRPTSPITETSSPSSGIASAA